MLNKSRVGEEKSTGAGERMEGTKQICGADFSLISLVQEEGHELKHYCRCLDHILFYLSTAKDTGTSFFLNYPLQ